MNMKSGKELYAEDVLKTPLYHDGTPRRTWEQLPEWAHWSWNKIAFNEGKNV